MGADDEAKSREGALEIFVAEHLELNVTYTIIPTADSVWDQKAAAALSSGSAGDVMQMSPDYYGMNTEYYIDLNPYVEAEGVNLDDVLVPGIIDGYYDTDGKLEGFPNHANCFVMAYNKDMFEQAGVAVPEAGWTLADLADWGQSFNTICYVLAYMPLSLILSFFLGWLLSRKVKFLGFWRTVFYMPYITSGVAVTILWGWIFNGTYGIINYVLSLFGITGPNWLGDKRLALGCIVVMCLWSLGNQILITLAGIQDIPDSYYESAQIDGATTLRQVFSITLPLSTPTIFFNLVIGVISAFQLFNQPYILTNGGPVDSTLTVAMVIFRNAFQYGKMGYASCIAWCLFIVIMIFTGIINATQKKWVFYDN